jgi:hypothetical protein
MVNNLASIEVYSEQTEKHEMPINMEDILKNYFTKCEIASLHNLIKGT